MIQIAQMFVVTTVAIAISIVLLISFNEMTFNKRSRLKWCIINSVFIFIAIVFLYQFTSWTSEYKEQITQNESK